MKQPLVSVVLTAYNEGKYIENSVQSILRQTFRDLELIIVDDGSKDDTLEKLESLCQQDERIAIVSQQHAGRSNALNKGIQRSRGKYIAIMDSGDTADPWRLQNEVEFLEQNGDVAIVGTWAYWVNEDEEIIGEWKSPVTVDRRNVYRAGGMVHSSIMCRRELFEKIGYYDPKLESAVDNDLFIRAVKSGAKIVSIPEFSMRVSQRASSICGNTKAVEKNVFKVKIRYLPHLLSLRNIIYTMMSFGGWVMPSFLLRSKLLGVFISRYCYGGRYLL